MGNVTTPGDFTNNKGTLDLFSDFRENDPLEASPHLPLKANLEPATNPYKDVGRNDPCPCGSGKKFKRCCL